jgi:hypothetical protein
LTGDVTGDITNESRRCGEEDAKMFDSKGFKSACEAHRASVVVAKAEADVAYAFKSSDLHNLAARADYHAASARLEEVQAALPRFQDFKR